MNKEDHKFWDDFQKALEQHDDKTLLKLGLEVIDVEYCDGLDEVTWAKAVQCFGWASRFGNVEATYHLANCYFGGGVGVEANDGIAFRLYKEAAEQGFADAQIALGEAYLQGWGVEMNAKEAIKWYEKAAASCLW